MALKVNGQVVQLASPDPEIIIEVDNSEDTSVAVQIRLTDVSQTDPAGRFRIRVNGDAFYIERAKTANWTTAQTLLTFSDEGTEIELSEQGFLELLEELQVHVEAASPLGLRFRELVQLAIT